MGANAASPWALDYVIPSLWTPHPSTLHLYAYVGTKASPSLVVATNCTLRRVFEPIRLVGPPITASYGNNNQLLSLSYRRRGWKLVLSTTGDVAGRG